MRAIFVAVLAAVSLSLGGPVPAQDSPGDAPVTPIPAPAPDLSVPETQDLACLANGQAYTPGEIACVPGCHGRQRLARCDVVAASADWTTISENCPTARVTPLPPGNPAKPTVLACTLLPNAPFAQIQ